MAMGLRQSIGVAALGAAMVFGFIGSANAEQTPFLWGAPGAIVKSVSDPFSLVAGQSYDFSAWLTNQGESYSGTTTGTATLIYLGLVNTAVSVVATVLNTGDAGTSASTLFTATNSGSYKIKFLLDNSDGTDATSGFGAIALHNVPGPVAGGGLPVVLGLVGFAAWRRRQAKFA